MNFKLYNLIAICLLFCITSCEEDDFTGHSKIKPTNPTITITGVGGNMTPVTDENNFDYPVSITMNETQVVDVAVHIFQTDGSATEDEDFSISESRVIIPKGELTGSTTITVLADLVTGEDRETFTIQIGDDRTANANITPVTATFSIDDYIPQPSPELKIQMTWSMDPDLDLDPYDYVDWDFFVYPEGWTDFFADEVTGFAAATGNAGEEAIISLDDLADGVYEVWVDLYDAFDPGDLAPVYLPISFSFSREFSAIEDVVIKSANDAFTTDQNFVSGDGSAFSIFATIEIANGEFIIKDAQGTLVIQGKLSQPVFDPNYRGEIISSIKNK